MVIEQKSADVILKAIKLDIHKLKGIKVHYYFFNLWMSWNILFQNYSKSPEEEP